jgi:hypothetical protein
MIEIVCHKTMLLTNYHTAIMLNNFNYELFIPFRFKIVQERGRKRQEQG